MHGKPTKVLMITPAYFKVEYQINPYMVNEQGELNQINGDEALRQWRDLKSCFENIGLKVQVLDGALGFPDMVFSANQCFPYIKDGKTSLLMSRMHSVHRQGEVPFIEKWAQDQGIPTTSLKSELSFEGMGDALWNYQTGEVFGGYGHRTDRNIYSEVSQVIGQKVFELELISPHFYHLDTCLSLLNSDSAVYVKEAFSDEGVDLLNQKFSNLIQIPEDEALEFFAGNCFCPDGTNVVLQKGAKKTIENLNNQGFKTWEVETGEFIKSGGSVFCLKMALL